VREGAKNWKIGATILGPKGIHCNSLKKQTAWKCLSILNNFILLNASKNIWTSSILLTPLYGNKQITVD
jgi:hypothetical protein